MKKYLILLVQFLALTFTAATAAAQSASADQLNRLPESAHASPILNLVSLLIMVAMLAAGWKVFSKAGEPGWAIIIPIYNVIVLLKIAGKPLWWIILLLIPLVNLVIAILVAIGIAKNFGKGGGFGVGLALLPFIFYPILGFGSATYVGQKTA